MSSDSVKPLSETSTVERGTPTDNAKTPQKMMNVVYWGISFAMLAGMLGFGVIIKNRITAAQNDAQQKKANQPTNVAENTAPKNFKNDKKNIKADELEADKKRKTPAATTPTPVDPNLYIPAAAKEEPAPKQSNKANNTTQKNTTPVETPHRRKMSGSVMVETDEVQGSEGNGVKQVSLLGRNEESGTSNRRFAKDSLDERLTPSELSGTKARLRSDLNFLLRRGTVIPCVLKTRIVSTYPGMASCQVSKDVYSANGKVLLIERGSEITGEQRTALNQGQARIFVLWSRLETPNGVSVDINSPAADALGATGLEADVDNHFWARFGGAIMLSLIDDVALAATSQNNGGGTTVNFSNTAGASQAMAAKVLENTINIPPTGYSNQGALLNVFIARDVDFKSVYDLITAEDR
jgi:type IV secretion system protein VirB10